MPTGAGTTPSSQDVGQHGQRLQAGTPAPRTGRANTRPHSSQSHASERLGPETPALLTEQGPTSPPAQPRGCAQPCLQGAPPALPSPKKPHGAQCSGLRPSYGLALLDAPQRCLFHTPGSNLIPKSRACAQHLLNPHPPSAGQGRARSCCLPSSRLLRCSLPSPAYRGGDGLLLGQGAKGTGEGAPWLVTRTLTMGLSHWQGASRTGGRKGTDPRPGYRPVALPAPLPAGLPPSLPEKKKKKKSQGQAQTLPPLHSLAERESPRGCPEPSFLSWEGQAKLQHF